MSYFKVIIFISENNSYAKYVRIETEDLIAS